MTLFALEPAAEMQGSALFSRDGQNRREIRRWWVQEPQRWAAWLMLNPSTANKDRHDPTTHRVTHFSRTWGYDGWVIVNLYPFISSTPEAMWSWANWQNHGPAWDVRDDLQANLADIERVGRAAALRMVAFGASPMYHDESWLEQCIEAFSQPSDIIADDAGVLYCLGTNTLKQPLHPMARGRMRVPDSAQPIPWSR